MVSLSTALPSGSRAAAVGIQVNFKDLRGAAEFLPRRLAVVGQGSTAASFPLEAFQILSAQAAGDRFGFGSPIHRSALRLLPENGDGVGTVPVIVFPLADDPSGVAAVATVDTVGVQTTTAAYTVIVNEVRSQPFTVLAAATADSVLVQMRDAVNAIVEMPVTAAQVTTAANAATMTTGAVGALALFQAISDGSFNITVDAGPAGDITGMDFTADVNMDGVAATISTATTGVTVTYDGTQNKFVFTSDTTGATSVVSVLSVAAGGTDLSIATLLNALASPPAVLVAGGAGGDDLLELTAKWKGESGNDIFVEIEGEQAGITFVETQGAGGLIDPSVQPALDLFPDPAQLSDWVTDVLHLGRFTNQANLDLFVTENEGRWGPTQKAPFIVAHGTNIADVQIAALIPDGRKTDRTNALLVAPGSNNLPFEIAARQMARIVVIAEQNAPTAYINAKATGIVPGTDAEQWSFLERDFAVKAGVSCVRTLDGVVSMYDTVTFYHPDGQTEPAYRYYVTIVKVQNGLWQLRLEFEGDEWAGKPLLPDFQKTVNPLAKKPKMAKAAVAAIIDALGLNAIFADPVAAKATLQAEIDPGNPNRINIVFTAAVSGNVRQIAVDFNFGFFFGGTV